MKRIWHTFLAVVAMATLANSANAQLNPSGEIGSYQSILSRAGYGDVSQSVGSAGSGYGQAVSSQMPVPPVPNAGMALDGSMGVGPTTGQSGSYGGGAMYGSLPAYQGGIVNGGVVGSPPVATPGIPVQPVQGGVISGGVAGAVGNGVMVDQGYVDNGMAVPTPSMANPTPVAPAPTYSAAPVVSYSAPVQQAPIYSAPVYAAPTYQVQPVYVAGESFAQSRPSSNLVVGVFGVSLRRDYEDDIRLGYNAAGKDFFTTDLDHGNMNGIGASLARRGANGRGFEVRYWGLDEDTSIDIDGPTFTYIPGYQDLRHGPSGATVKDIYDAGDSARIYRSTEIHSIEFNLLRNGGHYQGWGGRASNYELFGGFRLFQFDESLRYSTNSSSAGFPSTLEHRLEAENLLTGLQVGARNEICLGKRLRLSKGFNVGIFNNRINTSNRVFDENGVVPTLTSGPSTGREFDYQDTKNDVAFLGQFNAGLIYQLSNKTRLRAGYQALGVAGVALAGDQLPRDFTDSDSHQRANSNGSLLLHGFFYGAEVCF